VERGLASRCRAIVAGVAGAKNRVVIHPDIGPRCYQVAIIAGRG
jgi:hypothetical protein